MRSVAATLGSVVLCMLVGCGGGDVCSLQAKQLDDCGIEVTDEMQDECREQLEPCTAKEKRDLAKYVKCTEDEGLTLCGEFDDDAAIAAVLTCVLYAAEVSEACRSFSLTTDPTSTSYSTY